MRKMFCLINSGLLSLQLFASEYAVLEQQAPPTAAIEKAESTMSNIRNVSAIMVGCNLERKCMQAMLEEITQNNPNPLYQNLLLVLSSQQEQIDFEAAACQTAEIRVLRKDAAYCISDIMTKANQQVGSNDGIKNELNVCIQNKMENWAKKGNLFAQGLLANRAGKLGETNAKNYWEKLIQNQVGTSSYATFIRCSASFQLIPPGISEVAFQSLKHKS